MKKNMLFCLLLLFSVSTCWGWGGADLALPSHPQLGHTMTCHGMTNHTVAIHTMVGHTMTCHGMANHTMVGHIMTRQAMAGHRMASHGMASHNMAIHTYGGAGLLQKVFNAVAMLIYGNQESGIDKTFHALLRICLAFGGLCSIGLAFFREKFEPFIKSFFLPSIAVMSCLLVPRTTVYIHDHLAQKSPSPEAASFTKVDNVPLFLGKFASIISTVSYNLTAAMEGVAHGVNDRLYDWTGHIYAGDHLFQARKCRLANPLLEDNFREFCRECVFRDVGIGIYSKEELIHEKNLLQFLERKTSGIRTVYYREAAGESGKKSTDGSFIPCREAMKKMNALFNSAAGNTQEIVLGEIGNDFQYLLGQSKAGDLKSLLKQQMAIQMLKEEVPGTTPSFEAKRAELLQKENQKILGALGASSIVAMRNFFEATIYMVFPLVLLLSLASFGLKPILQWTQFVLWVNTWPPFYVVVKFLLSSIWSLRTQQAFGEHFDLTIFTSEGLSDLYSSMESIAAISMAFIPYLSWILLKGGVSQMVHMASSMMSPAQSAAGSAAAEKVYGNYSLGSVNMENVSGYNAQVLHRTLSGRLDHGNTTFNDGTMVFTQASDGQTIAHQQASQFPTAVSLHSSTSTAHQKAWSQAFGSVLSSSAEYAENATATQHRAVGLVNALSQSSSASESSSFSVSTAAAEAAQNIRTQADQWSKMSNISYSQALQEVISMGLDTGFGMGGSQRDFLAKVGAKVGAKGGLGGSYQDGVSKSDSHQMSGAQSIADSVSRSLQTLSSAAAQSQGTSSQSDDVRLHQDFSQSFQQAKTSSERYHVAYSEAETLTDQITQASTSQLSVSSNLNDAMVQEALKQGLDVGELKDVLQHPDSPAFQRLYDSVIQRHQPSYPIQTTPAGIKEGYDNSRAELPVVSEKEALREQQEVFQQGAGDSGLKPGDVKSKVVDMHRQVRKTQSHDEVELAQREEKVTDRLGSGIAETNAAVSTNIAQDFYERSTLMYPARKSLQVLQSSAKAIQASTPKVAGSVKRFFGKKTPPPPPSLPPNTSQAQGMHHGSD